MILVDNRPILELSTMSHFELMSPDDGSHGLLEPPSPAYSNVTVRRAFIVWLHCGQRNEFRDVCNYYHHLESLEDTLPANKRASSRLQEFNLLSENPPYSYYLQRLYPTLYKQGRNTINIKKVQEITLEDCVFNLEGFHQMKQKGVTGSDIIKASQIIRKYCKTHSKSLKKFLAEFQDFAKKCKIPDSVSNVVVYIKKKNVQDEIETWRRLPQHFSFLDVEASAEEISTNLKTSKSFYSVDSMSKHNNIRILINGSRKDIMSLSNEPPFSKTSSKNVSF